MYSGGDVFCLWIGKRLVVRWMFVKEEMEDRLVGGNDVTGCEWYAVQHLKRGESFVLMVRMGPEKKGEHLVV